MTYQVVSKKIKISVNKNIRFKVQWLRSDLCDYSDAFIVVKGAMSITGINDNSKRNKELTFKNNAPFRSSVTKINNTFIDSTEDLDIVIPMFIFLEYSDRYSIHQDVCGIIYSRDEINNANESMVGNNKTMTTKSFKYKTKIIESTLNDGNRLNKFSSIKTFEQFLEISRSFAID